MGLLNFNNEDAQIGLGLLAAAGARSDGANFGQRLLEGLSQGDRWKAQQAAAKRAAMQDQMAQMQMAQAQKQIAMEQAAMEQSARKRDALPGLWTGGSQALSPLMGDPSAGILPSAGRAAVPGSFDVQKALQAGYTPEEIAKLDALRNIGQNKVARTIKGMQNGREVEQQVDDFGRLVGQGFEQFKAPIMVDRGGQIDAVSPYMAPGQTFAKTMTFGDKNAAGNLALSRERLNMDKTKAAAETANGGYSAKPLPAAALKMQSEAVDAINTASGINQQLADVAGKIDAGKLSFGPISNAVNSARNTMGMSSEGSRNLASFRSTMEKLRNDSLRLNAGVQTDGDAQRAWNELFQNINDTDLVKQRLQEITALNKRGEELQRLKVDQIRGNYNAPPMDFTKMQGAPSGVSSGGSSGGWGIQRVN